jgi:hypothetical protein
MYVCMFMFQIIYDNSKIHATTKKSLALGE